MKHLLLFFIIFALFGCGGISPKNATTQSANYADLKTAYQPCFIIDKKLSKHAAVISTPAFMDSEYGFFAENHFKRDRTVILEVGQMIEKDVYAMSREMFDNQCVINSFNEFTGQGNLIIKVDLVSSNINVPADHNDKIVSELVVLYSFYDTQGKELFRSEVFEQENLEASSSAAYRKVINKTVDKLIASSQTLITQSLKSIN